MRIYFAAPLFSQAERQFNQRLTHGLEALGFAEPPPLSSSSTRCFAFRLTTLPPMRKPCSRSLNSIRRMGRCHLKRRIKAD